MGTIHNVRIVHPPWFENTYEALVLRWLETLDRFLSDRKCKYALFGGAALAAYLGQLPRRVHDLDYLVEKKDMALFGDFLVHSGFAKRTTTLTERGNFSKYVLSDYCHKISVELFPASFNILDIDQPTLPTVETLDLAATVQRTSLRTIESLDGSSTVAVCVVPIEDLLLLKLLPAFEPSMIQDVYALLASVAISRNEFDLKYFARRVRKSPKAWRRTSGVLSVARKGLTKSVQFQCCRPETTSAILKLIEKLISLTK
jgi:hypothetical protein